MVLSEVERLGLRKRNYKGLTMFELSYPLRPAVKATFALSPTEKVLMKGVLSVDRHEGSHSFPDEVVISVWTRDPPFFERRAENDGYYRLEIPVRVDIAKKLFERALEKLWLLPERRRSDV